MSEPPAGAPPAEITFGPRIRKSPFFDATRRAGAKAFSVYNRMYMPVHYGDPVADYWHLVEGVTLWDVACERQIEITGKDAARFVQLLTSRNLARCNVGQCRYLPITAEDGGMLNDPILLRLGESRFWLSLADSDLLLWARAVAWRSGMEVDLAEPDVSPLQLQGPSAAAVMAELFGEWILDLRYFHCQEAMFDGMPLLISRTGWSGELGYEIFLRDSRFGDRLWEQIMQAGRPHGLRPGAPSSIRRIEAGILSYGADMTPDVNPFELGLERFVDLDMEAEFIGKSALRRIWQQGVRRRLVGLTLWCDQPTGANEEPWIITLDGQQIGLMTSSAFSPRLGQTIALALVPIAHSSIGSLVTVQSPTAPIEAMVTPLPFIVPPPALRASKAPPASLPAESTASRRRKSSRF